MKTFAMLALAATAMPALAQPPAPPIAGTRLDVSAEGEVVRAPDMVGIGAGVVTQAATADAAMRDNATRMAAVLAALKRAGIADRDVQTASLSLQPQYRYAENQPPALTGYQASNQVNVRFRDIKRTGAVLDALVAAGANRIDGPNLTVDRLDAALDEARTKAVAVARSRAELYAKAAGLRVGRIVSIGEGGTSGGTPMPPQFVVMRMAKAEADTAISAGEQRLVATVNVTFELN